MGLMQAETTTSTSTARPTSDHCHTCGAPGDSPPTARHAPVESLPLHDLLATLPVLAAEARSADQRLRERVSLLKDRRATWAEIGSALSVTRQAAWERFGRGSRRTG